jgi:peptidoglycan/xylan/chitin deacetylase (PgdA/CDA1 family)
MLAQKIYKFLHPPIGVVLMLHRVVSERSLLAANRLLEVTPEFLDRTIASYVSKGYKLISLDELKEILLNRKKIKNPFVCFTLDDGYKDNFETAYPIFRKHSCPFAIYLTTDFPEKKALLWWYILEDILKKKDEIVLGNGFSLKTATLEEKNSAFNYIRQIIFSEEGGRIDLLLRDLICINSPFISDQVAEMTLSWDHIIELSKDELCTIGSHTVSHPALNMLSHVDLIAELVQSKKIIEQRISLWNL